MDPRAHKEIRELQALQVRQEPRAFPDRLDPQELTERLAPLGPQERMARRDRPDLRVLLVRLDRQGLLALRVILALQDLREVRQRWRVQLAQQDRLALAPISRYQTKDLF